MKFHKTKFNQIYQVAKKGKLVKSDVKELQVKIENFEEDDQVFQSGLDNRGLTKRGK